MMEEMKKAQELIQQAYKRGFKDGRKDGFTEGQEKAVVIEKIIIDSDKYIEQGRNEAWEAVKKIYLSIFDGGLSGDEMMKIFGKYTCLNDIPKKFSASEAIEKLRAYEDKKNKEFKVGDVVKMNEHSAVITWCDGNTWNGICIQGDSNEVGMTYYSMNYCGWTKTGETIPEIVKVLKK